MPEPDHSPTQQLAEAGRAFHRRGWAVGTSGNFSVLLARRPLRICLTPAGNESGTFDETNFLEIDDDAEILQGFGRPSDETLLHLSIYRLRPRARCILYSHSVWGTLLADRLYADGGIRLSGYEVLKGIAGVTTHEHIETIPIIENSQDHVAQSHVIENVLHESGNIHGIFIRKHGLFTWGETVAEARRHVEIFEHLFEILCRQKHDW
jgi:methylthioribulose-1-phosphate dehydratase